MSGADRLLPAGFESLEPFVAAWAISGTANRSERRDASTPAERTAFYDSASELLGPALEHLGRKPLASMDAADQRLIDLMLSLAHVALAVEVQGEAEARHLQSRRFMPITASSADWGR